MTRSEISLVHLSTKLSSHGYFADKLESIAKLYPFCECSIVNILPFLSKTILPVPDYLFIDFKVESVCSKSPIYHEPPPLGTKWRYLPSVIGSMRVMFALLSDKAKAGPNSFRYSTLKSVMGLALLSGATALKIFRNLVLCLSPRSRLISSLQRLRLVLASIQSHGFW